MKQRILYLLPLALLLAGVGVFLGMRKPAEKWLELPVQSEHFEVSIAQSGTVQPENKISITAPIAGRIEKILVDEGTKVKRGQVLARMSSTDRAALLDTAEAQGQEAVKEWLEVYKPTPIISPSSGLIIAKNVVEGQTVSLQTSLFDLSDRLIVMADVDETDLGKIHLGQEATVKVDSFPDLPVRCKVSRIAHQSITKNSINTYQVQLEPENLPREFRAGLTASVYFKHIEKSSALVLPTWVAEGRENFTTPMRVKGAKEGEQRQVRFGASNGLKIEVLEGLAQGEIVLVKEQKVLSQSTSTNPFGPKMPGRSGGGGGGGRH